METIRKTLEGEFDSAFLGEVFDDDRIQSFLCKFNPDEEDGRKKLINFIRLLKKDLDEGEDMNPLEDYLANQIYFYGP